MISHFEKLNTPLKSVHTYPTLQDQISRFSSRGWSSVVAWTLWEAWANSAFLIPSARRELDDVESFDEWEEFALFGSHYCVVHAKSQEDLPALKLPLLEGETQFPVERITMSYQEHPGQRRQRRFGVAMSLESPLGERFIANVMGSGNSSRLSSSDLYRTSEISGDIVVNGHGPAGRMCHTSTEIGSSRVLIVGGRTSPTNPLRDCWVFAKGANRWETSHDLPIPLYRHSVTGLRKSSLALLIGGKTGASTIFGGCLLFHPERGWRKCNISGYPYQPVFGANFVWTSRESTTKHSGLLVGGISADSEVAEQLLSWTLDVADLDVSQMPSHPLPYPIVQSNGCRNRLSLSRTCPCLLLCSGGCSIGSAQCLSIVTGISSSLVASPKTAYFLGNRKSWSVRWHQDRSICTASSLSLTCLALDRQSAHCWLATQPKYQRMEVSISLAEGQLAFPLGPSGH